MIADPPPLLYVKGALTDADDRAVAIVGSRSASDYGRRVARDLARGLASLGFTVVSGMARGIDGMAHESALRIATGAPSRCWVPVSSAPTRRSMKALSQDQRTGRGDFRIAHRHAADGV